MGHTELASDPGETRGEPISPESLKAALELWSQAGERHYIPLNGNSMRPLLWDGDQVLVSHNLNAVQPGDIVVFQRSHELVAHRVLVSAGRSEERVLRTKGDSFLFDDPVIPEDQIFGRVLAVRRADRQMRTRYASLAYLQRTGSRGDAFTGLAVRQSKSRPQP